MRLEHIIKTITYKKLFLIDSLGALITALILGFVLTSFEDTFGMPAGILYILSLIAFIYSIYSSLCYLLIKTNFILFLKVIAIANLLYCFITIALVICL